MSLPAWLGLPGLPGLPGWSAWPAWSAWSVWLITSFIHLCQPLLCPLPGPTRGPRVPVVLVVVVDGEVPARLRRA